MKRPESRIACAFALLFLFNACASKDEVASDAPTQSAASVPGEKVSGEGMTPGVGPSGAAANVRW